MLVEHTKSKLTVSDIKAFISAIEKEGTEINKLNVVGEFAYLWARRTVSSKQLDAFLSALTHSESKRQAKQILLNVIEIDPSELVLAKNS
jgi:hypothetical protein